MIKRIPSDILHMAESSPSLEVRLEIRLDSRPDLNSGAVTSIRHGDVVDVYIFHNVDLSLILAERTNADTVGAGTIEVLDHYVSAVRLERDTICKEISPLEVVRKFTRMYTPSVFQMLESWIITRSER